MGESLLAGMLDSGTQADDVTVVEQRPERAAQLAQQYGVHVAADGGVSPQTQLLLVAVKPHDVATALASVAAHLPAETVVVSVAAGLTTARLESLLPDGQPVVRAMPNTPALVRAGISAICAGRHAGPDHLDTARALLASVGAVVVVPEAQMDAVAAVSGSGPAYLFLVVEALVEAGVRVGLPRDLATTLAAATLSGSSRLLETTGEHPAVLRERVTSPGGTTAAALHQLERHGLRAAFLDAVVANRDRSVEMSAD
jgi:pyrroline-5-carboxylate reductase